MCEREREIERERVCVCVCDRSVDERLRLLAFLCLLQDNSFQHKFVRVKRNNSSLLLPHGPTKRLAKNIVDVVTSLVYDIVSLVCGHARNNFKVLPN